MSINSFSSYLMPLCFGILRRAYSSKLLYCILYRLFSCLWNNSLLQLESHILQGLVPSQISRIGLVFSSKTLHNALVTWWSHKYMIIFKRNSCTYKIEIDKCFLSLPYKLIFILLINKLLYYTNILYILKPSNKIIKLSWKQAFFKCKNHILRHLYWENCVITII